MAFTIPTYDEFIDFAGDDLSDVNEERAEMFIQLAADLFWFATGLDADPEDDRIKRLVKNAVLDMAIFSYVSREDLTSSYSPFSSERIGSYSYTKNFTAKAKDGSTGVPLFDQMVAYFAEDLANVYGSSSSEEVFTYGYIPPDYRPYTNIDPAAIGSHRWLDIRSS